MYVERPSRLSGAVVWRSTPDEVSAGSAVLPDGCMDLIWLGDHLIVAGPDTRPQYGPASTADVIGLRFAPGEAPGILGVPADALRDQRVALADVWATGSASRAHERVVAAAHIGSALEDLAGRLGQDGPSSSPLRHVAELCDAGWSTAAIAAETGWSERTLHRYARRRFGYGTTTLTRILRFQRAAALIRADRPLADVAATTGYADQPHLSREVRRLSGCAPSELR